MSASPSGRTEIDDATFAPFSNHCAAPWPGIPAGSGDLPVTRADSAGAPGPAPVARSRGGRRLATGRSAPGGPLAGGCADRAGTGRTSSCTRGRRPPPSARRHRRVPPPPGPPPRPPPRRTPARPGTGGPDPGGGRRARAARPAARAPPRARPPPPPPPPPPPRPTRPARGRGVPGGGRAVRGCPRGGPRAPPWFHTSRDVAPATAAVVLLP